VLTHARYYLATSRELKRLDAVSRSPIFAWFSESLNGLSTIHAFRQQTIFTQNNHFRIDRNQICYLPSISVNRWLAVRLEFVGALIILTVSLLAMAALITTGVNAGLVGLVLSYALNTTSSLVRAFPYPMEKLHDSHLSLELAGSVRERSRAKHCQCGAHSTSNFDWAGSASWVTWQKALAGLAVGRGGRILVGFLWFVMTGPQFTIFDSDYSTRYRPGLDLVLKNVDIKIVCQALFNMKR